MKAESDISSYCQTITFIKITNCPEQHVRVHVRVRACVLERSRLVPCSHVIATSKSKCAFDPSTCVSSLFGCVVYNAPCTAQSNR